MKRDRSNVSELYANSIRRDAWRAELLHEELAEKSAARRRAVTMRWTIAAGIAIGAIGSYVTHFQ
jgi:hypothetical protein